MLIVFWTQTSVAAMILSKRGSSKQAYQHARAADDIPKQLTNYLELSRDGRIHTIRYQVFRKRNISYENLIKYKQRAHRRYYCLLI
jgi:hypothetical protein